jgi:mRNA interferase HigB
MRIIARSTLKSFWERSRRHADAREPLLAWYRHVAHARWKPPTDIKADLRTASVLKHGRVVFNIAGNKYRVVVRINYPYQVVCIRFVGTHLQYDAVDAETI